MTGGTHARPPGDATAPDPATSEVSRRPRRPWGPWRLATPLVVLAAGALFVVSADNSEGTDLRPGRYADLADLVAAEADRYDALQREVAELTDEVGELTRAVDDQAVSRVQRRIVQLRDPAGMVARTGPGITVVLSDAPEERIAEVIEAGDLDPNLLLVHQQDIQAVVNALWQGGATAVTLQGQRVISTTGIKCEGNSVTIQGRPYPQPYVVQAVGDPPGLIGALLADDYLGYYRDQAEDPRIGIGWELETEAVVEAPAYDGLLDLGYAEPLR